MLESIVGESTARIYPVTLVKTSSGISTKVYFVCDEAAFSQMQCPQAQTQAKMLTQPHTQLHICQFVIVRSKVCQKPWGTLVLHEPTQSHFKSLFFHEPFGNPVLCTSILVLQEQNWRLFFFAWANRKPNFIRANKTPDQCHIFNN